MDSFKSVIVSGSLPSDAVLWRYMSLDKFIHLLHSKSLFLSPLSFFSRSDPLEGLLPKKFHNGLAHHVREMFSESFLGIQENKTKFSDIPHAPLMLEDIEERLKISKLKLNKMLEIARKRKCICCWYGQNHESEAMWKLYGDNGKAVAIKTKVGALEASINSRNNSEIVFLDKVRYIDFDCDELKFDELGLSKSNASILLKRQEYDHEREVRLYIIPNEHDLFNSRNMLDDYWLNYKIKPRTLDIDIDQLIEEIIISPFAGEPFLSSINIISKQFGIDQRKIRRSTLLEEYEEI